MPIQLTHNNTLLGVCVCVGRGGGGGVVLAWILLAIRLVYCCQDAVGRARSDGVVFLELNWEDTTTFSIPECDLVQCIHFIHQARLAGGSVLVHCAQVQLN